MCRTNITYIILSAKSYPVSEVSFVKIIFHHHIVLFFCRLFEIASKEFLKVKFLQLSCGNDSQ